MAIVGRMMSHFRRRKMFTYSLGFRCLNSTLITHSYLHPVTFFKLQPCQHLLRVFYFCKRRSLGQLDRGLQLTTGLFPLALFFQSHSEMVVISRARRGIRSTSLCFVKRYCFAELFD